MTCKKMQVRWCSFCDFAVENEWTDPFMTDPHGGGGMRSRSAPFQFGMFLKVGDHIFVVPNHKL